MRKRGKRRIFHMRNKVLQVIDSMKNMKLLFNAWY